MAENSNNLQKNQNNINDGNEIITNKEVIANNQLSNESKTFILCFITVIWRRIWLNAEIYSNHKKVEVNDKIILKCLKYQVLSDTGLTNQMKPYLIKALRTGFLMPNEYKNDIYVTKSIKLFKPAYEIICLEDRYQEFEFMNLFASTVYDDDYFDENMNESIDTLKAARASNNIINNTFSVIDLFNEENVHRCNFCDQVDVWDIDIRLNDTYSDDPFKKIILYGLTACINYSTDIKNISY